MKYEIRMTGTPTDAWKGAMEMKTKTTVNAGCWIPDPAPAATTEILSAARSSDGLAKGARP